MKWPTRMILTYLLISGVRPDLTIEQLPIVTAALGQNVALPCHLKVSNDNIISKPVPYWVYGNDQEKLWTDPSERYQNRVSLLIQDPQSLDKSIRLKHVQWEDAGKYQCKVSVGMQQGGRFRKKGNETELLIYGRISFGTTVLNNSQLQCEVPVSRHPGFALSISYNDQILKSAPGPNSTSALYETLSQTISLRSHRKYQCSLNFNGKLVSSRVYEDQDEEHPQPWFLYGGLILVQLVVLLVVTIVMLWNSCL